MRSAATARSAAVRSAAVRSAAATRSRGVWPGETPRALPQLRSPRRRPESRRAVHAECADLPISNAEPRVSVQAKAKEKSRSDTASHLAQSTGAPAAPLAPSAAREQARRPFRACRPADQHRRAGAAREHAAWAKASKSQGPTRRVTWQRIPAHPWPRSPQRRPQRGGVVTAKRPDPAQELRHHLNTSPT